MARPTSDGKIKKSSLRCPDPSSSLLCIPEHCSPKFRRSASFISSRSGSVSTPRGGPGSREERWQRLTSLGMPPGLAKIIDKEDHPIKMRFFILDNSASTAAYDGKYFETAPNGNVYVVPCTRWEEIKRCALSHAIVNVQMGTPCEFLLLNPGPDPNREGVAYVRIDEARGDVPSQMRLLKDMLQSSRPHGVTPLVHCLKVLQDRIEKDQKLNTDVLKRHVFLVIITDGVPTGLGTNISTPEDKGSFMESIRSLAVRLPVHVVIRLCTDDPKTLEFYNEVETELELPLDVLDDFESEANEIYQCGNNWFVYTLDLHRIREGGTFIHIFDILDERRLTTVEAAFLAQMLLCSADEPNLPREPKALCDAVEQLATGMPSAYDVRIKASVPMVNHKLFWLAVRGNSAVDEKPSTCSSTDDISPSRSSTGHQVGHSECWLQAPVRWWCQKLYDVGGEDDSEAVNGIKQIT